MNVVRKVTVMISELNRCLCGGSPIYSKDGCLLTVECLTCSNIVMTDYGLQILCDAWNKENPVKVPKYTQLTFDF